MNLSLSFWRRVAAGIAFGSILMLGGATNVEAADSCTVCKANCTNGGCWSNDSGVTCVCFQKLPPAPLPPIELIPECDDAEICLPPAIAPAKGAGTLLALSAKLVKGLARCEAAAVRGKASRTDLAACEAKALAKLSKDLEKLRVKKTVPPGIACSVDSLAEFEVIGHATQLVRAAAAAAAFCPADCIAVCSGDISVSCTSDADCQAVAAGTCGGGVQICP